LPPNHSAPRRSRAATPVTTGAVPVIVYPSNATRFPRNIYKVLFQWVKKGNNRFRVTFAGNSTHLPAMNC